MLSLTSAPQTNALDPEQHKILVKHAELIQEQFQKDLKNSRQHPMEFCGQTVRDHFDLARQADNPVYGIAHQLSLEELKTWMASHNRQLSCHVTGVGFLDSKGRQLDPERSSQQLLSLLKRGNIDVYRDPSCTNNETMSRLFARLPTEGVKLTKSGALPKDPAKFVQSFVTLTHRNDIARITKLITVITLTRLCNTRVNSICDALVDLAKSEASQHKSNKHRKLLMERLSELCELHIYLSQLVTKRWTFSTQNTKNPLAELQSLLTLGDRERDAVKNNELCCHLFSGHYRAVLAVTAMITSLFKNGHLELDTFYPIKHINSLSTKPVKQEPPNSIFVDRSDDPLRQLVFKMVDGEVQMIIIGTDCTFNYAQGFAISQGMNHLGHILGGLYPPRSTPIVVRDSKSDPISEPGLIIEPDDDGYKITTYQTLGQWQLDSEKTWDHERDFLKCWLLTQAVAQYDPESVIGDIHRECFLPASAIFRFVVIFNLALPAPDKEVIKPKLWDDLLWLESNAVRKDQRQHQQRWAIPAPGNKIQDHPCQQTPATTSMVTASEEVDSDPLESQLMEKIEKLSSQIQELMERKNFRHQDFEAVLRPFLKFHSQLGIEYSETRNGSHRTHHVAGETPLVTWVPHRGAKHSIYNEVTQRALRTMLERSQLLATESHARGD